MFHVKHLPFSDAEIEQIQIITKWPEDDFRWKNVADFLERVRGAGLNLVSRADRERLIERHLLPSLEAIEYVGETGTLLDVGSGGGFPGIPLALAMPELQVVFIESNERKTAFLKRVCREIGIKNVEVVRGRVEELDSHHDDKYDIVTARAIAKLPELIGWTARLLKADGRWLLWKEREWRKEGDLDKLGVELIAEKTLTDGRALIALKKKLKD
jgi:16S rRNA (guanine527-N7)-methyltransferase